MLCSLVAQFWRLCCHPSPILHSLTCPSAPISLKIENDVLRPGGLRTPSGCDWRTAMVAFGGIKVKGLPGNLPTTPLTLEPAVQRIVFTLGTHRILAQGLQKNTEW